MPRDEGKQPGPGSESFFLQGQDANIAHPPGGPDDTWTGDEIWQWIRFLARHGHDTTDVWELFYNTPSFTFANPFHWATDILDAPRTSLGKPMPIWAVPKANGLAPHYLIDQQRFISMTAVVHKGSTLDVPIVDNEGVPLIDPSFPPMIVVRGNVNLNPVGSDFIASPTNGVWSDEGIGIPLKRGLTAPSNSWLWSLVLKRQPMDHWVVRMAPQRQSDTDTSADTYAYGFLVTMLGQSSVEHFGVTPYDHNSGGSSWDDGRWRIIAVQGAGNVNSRDIVNGDLARANQLIALEGAENVSDAASPVTVYLSTPDMLVGDTEEFGTMRPMVRVFAHPGPTGSATTSLTVHQNWVGATFGQGFTNALASPPVNQPDQAFFEYKSELDFNSSKWRVRLTNGRSTSTRTMYVYATGNSAF